MKKLIISLLILGSAFSSFSQKEGWFSNGPNSVHIHCLDVAKSNPAVIYLGTFGNGIYKSTDYGNIWEVCSHNGFPIFSDSIGFGMNNQPSWWFGSFYPVTCIAIHPNDTQHLFIAFEYGGVFESTDGGVSWQSLNLPINTVYSKIIIDDTDTNYIWILSGRYSMTGSPGLYFSNDGGKSWYLHEQIPMGENVQLTDLTIDPQNNKHIILSVDCDTLSGLVESFNQGWNWHVINRIYKYHDLVFDKYNSSHLYSIIYNHWTDWLLGESYDGGITWTTINVGNQGSWNTSLLNDNLNYIYISNNISPQYIYKGKVNESTWETIDTMDTWFSVNLNRQMRANSAGLYFGNYFGFYFSESNANQFNSRNGNLTNSYINEIAVNPENENIVYAAGEQGFWISRDGTQSWSQQVDWTAKTVAVDPQHPDTIYFGGFKLMRSFNGGKTTVLLNALGSIDAILVNPKKSNILYYRSQNRGLYKSVDYGEHWSRIHSLTNAGSLSIDPTFPDTIYYGRYRSSDGGINWNFIENNVVCIDPNNSQILYALFKGKVSISTNWGSDWMVSDYVDYPEAAKFMNHFFIDPQNSNNIYYCAAYGIRYSHDQGLHWDWLKGVFDSRVLDIKVISNKNLFYIATHGGGVWSNIKINSVNDNIINTLKAISVYPNPFKKEQILNFSMPLSGKLEIYNLMGCKVFEEQLIDSENCSWKGTNVDATECKSGYYFIKISSKQGIMVFKLLML